MKFNLKFKAIGAVAAVLVAGALPTAANADAIAQSILNISNFTLRAGNGAAGIGGAIPAGLNINANTTADANSSLVGVGSDAGSVIAGGEQAIVGAAGFYNPGVKLLFPTAPAGTYSGSTSTQTGNAVSSSATALTDNTVSLAPSGDGSAQGNVNLNSVFNISNAVAGAQLEIKFDAESFLRAYLTKPGLARASYSWVVTLTDADGLKVFSWSPDGGTGGSFAGAFGGTEYADAFTLQDSRSQLVAGNKQVNNSLGGFEAETNGLAIGEYTLSISQLGAADARLLPEPGSLALLGTLLAGAAVATRRRASGK